MVVPCIYTVYWTIYAASLVVLHMGQLVWYDQRVKERKGHRRGVTVCRLRSCGKMGASRPIGTRGAFRPFCSFRRSCSGGPGDRRVIEVIESDLFLATMSDIYAYMAWPHMGLDGKMEGYSGFDPCWKMAHAVPLWVDGLEELSLLHTLPEWLALTEDRPVTLASRRMTWWMGSWPPPSLMSWTGTDTGNG